MDIKEVLAQWKSILGFVLFIAGTTYAYLAWAEDEKAVAEAREQLIHNEMYQESRIDRKRDQIREDERELDNVVEKVGNDEPSPRQARKISELDDNIDELKQEIEDIEVTLKTEHD